MTAPALGKTTTRGEEVSWMCSMFMKVAETKNWRTVLRVSGSNLIFSPTVYEEKIPVSIVILKFKGQTLRKWHLQITCDDRSFLQGYWVAKDMLPLQATAGWMSTALWSAQCSRWEWEQHSVSLRMQPEHLLQLLLETNKSVELVCPHSKWDRFTSSHPHPACGLLGPWINPLVSPISGS